MGGKGRRGKGKDGKVTGLKRREGKGIDGPGSK